MTLIVRDVYPERFIYWETYVSRHFPRWINIQRDRGFQMVSTSEVATIF